MNIDKQKLQPLLWAVVGAWKTGDQGLQLHTDALDEFLGASTVEEVALGLIAEVERLEADTASLEFVRRSHKVNRAAIEAAGHETIDDLAQERDQLKAENEKMRSFLAEVSRTSGDKWAVMAARNLLEDVDHG